MTLAAPWTLCLQRLDDALAALAQAQTAATDSPASGEADTLVQRCAALAQAMSALAPALQAARPLGAPPPDVQQRLQQLQSGLDTLHAHTAQLSAASQRALQQLFPADPLKAYSRLGQPRGPALGSAGYLKA